MYSPSDDALARVRALLPETVPVLGPKDWLIPAEWVEASPDTGRPKAGGRRGLVQYLKDMAPAGYVQVYREGIGTSTGVLELPSLQLDTYAPEHAQALALMEAVSRALLSRPTRPTPFSTAFTAQVLEETDQYCRLSLTFEVRKLGASYDSTQ